MGPEPKLGVHRTGSRPRFHTVLQNKGITPCIPSTRGRKLPIPHDTALYRYRHRIENMLGRLKDWRRIAMRYDHCAHTATVTFWLGQCILTLG